MVNRGFTGRGVDPVTAARPVGDSNSSCCFERLEVHAEGGVAAHRQLVMARIQSAPAHCLERRHPLRHLVVEVRHHLGRCIFRRHTGRCGRWRTHCIRPSQVLRGLHHQYPDRRLGSREGYGRDHVRGAPSAVPTRGTCATAGSAPVFLEECQMV